MCVICVLHAMCVFIPVAKPRYILSSVHVRHAGDSSACVRVSQHVMYAVCAWQGVHG